MVAERAQILAVAACIELALDKAELVTGVGKVVYVAELCIHVESVAGVLMVIVTLDQAVVAVE